MKPKVSIITTFYNSVRLGDFVHSAMQVLLNQTYRDIEFVCVNDGSTDQTLDQLKKYQAKDDRIILIDKENEGTAQYAKAAGQDVAQGEYIMLFDHDDSLDLDAVEKAVASFQQNPELDMVGFMCKMVYANNGKVKELVLLDEKIASTDEYRFKVMTGAQALEKTVGRYDFHFMGFYKKHIFKTVSFRYDRKLVNADEIVQRFLLEKVNKIGVCNAIYTYYLYENSSAKSFSPKLIDLLESDCLLREYFKSKNLYENKKHVIELAAYKNLVKGIKVFHTYSRQMEDLDKKNYLARIKKSYLSLDKKVVTSQFSGFAFIYNTFLLSYFCILFNFYSIKR